MPLNCWIRGVLGSFTGIGGWQARDWPCLQILRIPSRNYGKIFTGILSADGVKFIQIQPKEDKGISWNDGSDRETRA